MTNSRLLRDKVAESGLMLGFIAEKLGLSYGALKRKLDGAVDLKAYEIQILCELLHIVDLREKDAIFFAPDVEENSTKPEETA